MEIQFDLYRIFYHGARRLNFTQAAEELFVTQSAVSQSIKALEDRMGCALFYRHGRTLQLTEEGKTLFTYVEKAYNILKAGEASIASLSSLEAGTVRIGASDTIAKHYIMSALRTFHERHPKVKLSVNNRPSPISAEMLLNNRIDLAIVNLNPDKDYSAFNVMPLGEIRNGFICSAQLAEKFSKAVSLSELKAYPLISLEKNSTTRSVMDSFLKASASPMTPELEFGSNELIIEMTKLGLGIGFINLEPARADIQCGTLHEIHTQELIPAIKIAIIYSKSTPLSLASKTFVDIVLESFPAEWLQTDKNGQ